MFKKEKKGGSFMLCLYGEYQYLKLFSLILAFICNMDKFK